MLFRSRPSFFSFLSSYYIQLKKRPNDNVWVKLKLEVWVHVRRIIASLEVWMRLKFVKLLQVWVHVGRIPSNLMDSIHFGLTLQIFETSGGELQIFKLWD